LLCLRWFDSFQAWRRKLSWLNDLDCLKIAMPRDEYNHSEILDEWLRDLGVDHVFSNFGTDVRPLLYPHMSQHAEFHHAFTGYIDENVARKLETGLLDSQRRPLDVVYRATHLPYWLGSLGQLKYVIGERAQLEAKARGLKADISMRTDDAIMGDEWFDFLAAGRVVVGSESGSSVNDRRGEIQASVKAYLQEHPSATFDEVAARMPEGWDSHHFGAISPRHFEAVITKTCQVLVRGRYDDVFVPGRHYLPVGPDLGDLGDALQEASDPAVASEVATRAYEEIYRSGRYTYRALAEQIDRVLETRPARPTTVAAGASALAARFGSWRLNRPSDLHFGLTIANLDQTPGLATTAVPWIQIWRLLRHRHGRQLVAGALNGRVSRGLLGIYLRAGKAASSIPADRLVAEGRLLDRMFKAQAAQPRTPSFRAIQAVGVGTTLELLVLRTAPHSRQSVHEQSWPPRSIVVRLLSLGGLTAEAAGEGRHSGIRLDAVGALATLRPFRVQAALRQLLDSIGGARSRPRARGARIRLKMLLATTRMLFAQPSNLWLLSTSVGQAPLHDTADDLLKLALLRGVQGTTRVASHIEPMSNTLCLVSEPVGAPVRDSQIPIGPEIKRIVWDNSAVSNHLYAPVVFGRVLEVFLGAGGVHEFTAIEALPASARKAILRQLEG